MWNHFLEFHRVESGQADGPTNEQIELGKFIHYTCAMGMYNAFVSALRAPDPRQLLVVLTEAMKKDFDQYFKSGTPPTH